DAGGRPITDVGLWAMTFGNGAGGTRTDTLYFNAGINGEQDGLFASISPVETSPRLGLRGRAADGTHPGQELRDVVFALLGRRAGQQATAGPAQGLEARDRRAALPAPETLGAASNQVSAPVSEQHGPISAHHGATRPDGSAQGRSDPLTATDLWSVQ